MLERVPSSAKYPYRAFALAPPDAEEVRRLAHLVVAGEPQSRAEILAFFERAAPRTSDLRRTPLDPRLSQVIAKLRVIAEGPSESAENVAIAIADFVDSPRDVFAEVELTAMNAALRSLRLIELDAPWIILDNDLQALARAISLLDTPPPPLPHPGPPDDSFEFLEVADVIVRHARFDLCLGLHSETLRVLERVAKKHFGPDVAAGLCGGEPLLPFELLDRRAAGASDGERMILSRLRFWKMGPDLETFEEVASELADRLAATTAAVRAKVTKELDEDAPPVLRGDDYVASAAARLRAMAADATSARSQGLVLSSEMSRSLAYA
jgi:hypothetical protein